MGGGGRSSGRREVGVVGGGCSVRGKVGVVSG